MNIEERLLGSRTYVALSHCIPTIVGYTLDPLGVGWIEEPFHHCWKMVFEWPLDFDDILVGVVLVRDHQVVIVLDPLQWVHDHN